MLVLLVLSVLALFAFKSKALSMSSFCACLVCCGPRVAGLGGRHCLCWSWWLCLLSLSASSLCLLDDLVKSVVLVLVVLSVLALFAFKAKSCHGRATLLALSFVVSVLQA